jgi:AraC family transcriptional regulator of adaptative response/methylated-DNA-[protein]-cysteine methyltransferase
MILRLFMTASLHPERIGFQLGTCSLGTVAAAVSEKGLCCLTIGEEPQALILDLQARFPGAMIRDTENDEWFPKVLEFVETPTMPLDLPLDIRGTAFQQRVWQALCGIPSGSTATYAEIAWEIGQPLAVRAVASACAANALALVIPCHRVIRRDGNLSGYRWGIERKRVLLEREGVMKSC